MTKVVVVGGNFAGVTAALQLKKLGKDLVDVTVIDKEQVFTFVPSLIWVPIKRREVKDFTIPLEPLFTKHGVNFVHDEAMEIDANEKFVETKNNGKLEFDHIVICTGPKPIHDVAPGVAEHAHYIGTKNGANKARVALEEFLANGGTDIVIGATQGAGCMGGGYEFLFNVDQWLRENKARKNVNLTWVTPEPYIGHFGIEGMPTGTPMLKAFTKLYNINYEANVSVDKVTEDKVYLSNGKELDSTFTMLMPPFHGVDVVKNAKGFGVTPVGYVKVKDSYQSVDNPNVWAAGIAVQVDLPFSGTDVPFSIPKTGYPTDETAKMAAENLIRYIKGETKFKEKAWGKIPAMCIMNAGKKEILLLGTETFKPRKIAVLIPNLFNDWNKVLFEKYFLWKTKNGYSRLP